jgi:REP element-mobilizing transposase RayT
MRSNASAKGIIIDAVNGYEDHCHCLISFGRDQTISKTMQLLKGESAFWINKHNLCRGKFEWQDEYFAISVSESVIPRVRNYIRKQEQHHAKKTFQDEYDELMLRHKFQDSLSAPG